MATETRSGDGLSRPLNNLQVRKGPGWLYAVLSKPKSLRSRLAFWNALVILLTLLLKGLVVYQLVTSLLVLDLDSRLQIQASKLEAAALAASGRPLNAAFFHALVRGDPVSEFTTNSTYIKLFDTVSGHPIAFSSQLDQVLVPLKQGDFEAALHGQRVSGTWQDRDGFQVHTLTIALRDKQQRLIAVAQICQSLQVVKQVQAILVTGLLVGSLVAALLAYAVSFWLTSYELRPLRTLSSTMHNLSAQGLRTRLHPPKAVTEIEQLTGSFNAMAERLEASFALQHTFASDVSHELRTPLTAIQGQLDVLLLDRELKDEVHTDLQQVSAELRRLSRLVTNLLTTTRADAGMLPQPYAYGAQAVELDLLVVETARQARFLNQQRTLKIEELEQLHIPGDADMLKQMVLNLVDNALTYTPPSGQITLALARSSEDSHPVQEEMHARQAEWAVLSVCDTGPGIDPEDLPHIFKRHYRARHTTTSSKLGAGLGLSIARLIAEAHGGSITVESTPGKGTCFRVWLPLPPV
ncbi:MAG: HAMP domain-containing sensor histidine kinase [Ktedonobacteraceae bacterium]